jgi:hypothetical protein
MTRKCWISIILPDSLKISKTYQVQGDVASLRSQPALNLEIPKDLLGFCKGMLPVGFFAKMMMELVI